MTKILVAEDDKFLANAYRVKLTKSGFDIEIVGNGDEVIAALKKNKYDFLLIDLVMPIKDGFAVLEEIKSQKIHPIPIILIASNLGQKEDIDKAISLGANDFVVKSDMALDQLVAKIKSMLK